MFPTVAGQRSVLPALLLRGAGRPAVSLGRRCSCAPRPTASHRGSCTTGPGSPSRACPTRHSWGSRSPLDGADRRLRLWRRRGLERALRRGDVDAERLRRDDQVALALAEQVEAVAAQDHELEQQTAQFRLALFRQGLLSSSRPFCPGAQARADRDAAVPGPLFLPARRPGARPARSADEEKLPADKNDQ